MADHERPIGRLATLRSAHRKLIEQISSASEPLHLAVMASGRIKRKEVLHGAVSGGLQDMAVSFEVEFFSEIAGGLVQELSAGALLAGIPFFGGFDGMALDVKIAWTMTWRVGMMIAIYHENGGKWIRNRKHTYELVRKCIKLRKDGKRSVPTIAEVVAAVPEVQEQQVASVTVMADMLLSAGISKQQVREKLRERGISPELLMAA